MSGLRLGSLTEDRPVKGNAELSGAIMRDLADYARVHAKANRLAEPLPRERLIAPMVKRFMAGDRQLSKLRRQV